MEKDKFKKYINLLIVFIILIMNNSSSLFIFKVQYSEVSLKIKETGNIKILSDSFFQLYNQCGIYINANLQDISTNKYDFDNTESVNFVKIK